jgi:ribosomal protein S18 acetylase RimI-like enzyme
MNPQIRRLGAEHAPPLLLLRREALDTEPLAFAASVEDDVGLVLESVRGFLASTDTQAVFGQCQGTALVGMVGLVRSTKLKQRHKASIWGMYVQPDFRRLGVGRALLSAAIEQARAWAVDQVHLGVTEVASSAKQLYESAGFRLWGIEPRALHSNGRFVDEYHLVLDLNKTS